MFSADIARLQEDTSDASVCRRNRRGRVHARVKTNGTDRIPAIRKSTLTGRTGIWGFIEYQISHKPWLGWGFHSYYFVPNSPQKEAPGYIREMPSSHSGYLELKLETGRIGYWIFLVVIYSSLHLLEWVRRKDPALAWCFLSFELLAVLINLTDSNWLTITHFWLLYLIVVAVSVRYLWPSWKASSASLGPIRQVQVSRARLAARTQRAAVPGSVSGANISCLPD